MDDRNELALFPWLNLRDLRPDEVMRIGDWELLSLDIRESGRAHGELHRIATQVLRRYALSGGTPVQCCTLAKPVDRDWLSPLRDQFAETNIDQIVAFAGLARRYFFHQTGYCSTELFQADCWTLSSGSDGQSFSHTVRRKDGQLTQVFVRDESVFRRPDPIANVSLNDCGLDWHLARSLYSAVNSRSEWQDDLAEAIWHFNMASMDGWPMCPPMELVLVNGAYQRLMQMTRKEYKEEFQKRILEMIESSGVILACDERALIREWANEFWIIRGDLAHGRSKGGESRWSISAHVVLALTLFIPLVESFLIQKGRLSIDDAQHSWNAEAFAKYLQIEDIFSEAGQEAWREVDTFGVRSRTLRARRMLAKAADEMFDAGHERG